MPRSIVINPNTDWRTALAARIADAGPPGSQARAAELANLASSVRWPSGKREGRPIGERTLRGWVAALDKTGFAKAPRLGRADRGQSRVIAWRALDRALDAAGIPEARQREIAVQLRDTVRALWAGGGHSAFKVRVLFHALCADVLLAAGVQLAAAELDALCRPPMNFVADPELRRARHAHTKRTDAGGYAAKLKPRIRRHRRDLKPMDVVAADVRHSDIFHRRPDGSLATAKQVCFEDLATNRVFARSFLLPKGEMIGRKHVLMAIRDMLADPSWGAPRAWYMDNGSEFRIGASADDLAQLVALVRDVAGMEMRFAGKEELPVRPMRIGRQLSLPFNPQSKKIEGTFSGLSRIEAMRVGYVGGNRMAKKVENQGKAPKPMPGGEAEIIAAFDTNVAFHNSLQQQKGEFAGRSPNDVFAAFVAAGWHAIALNPAEFDLAFGKDETRTVQTGGELHIDARVFRHDVLALMVGERVQVRIPILGDGSRVVVLDGKGRPSCVAEEDQPVAFNDPKGAGESARRGKELAQRVRAGAGPIRVDVERALARAIRAAPAPNPPQSASIDPILRQAAAEPAGERQALELNRRNKQLDRQAAALRALAAAPRVRDAG